MGNRRLVSEDRLPEICQINDVKTVKQSTYYYCAAACISMCLDLDMSQDEIYQMLNAATVDQENWYVEPDAVYDFLSKYGSFLRTSAMHVSSLEATEWILSCMIQRQTSAPMLVAGGKHWVVYAGYQMNPRGTASGIYIRDPWPTTASLSFYSFTKHFFDDYFCKINVEGNWKDRVESFVNADTKKCVEIDVIQKPTSGGMFTGADTSYFKKQIISDDLSQFGFGNVGFIKHGGSLSEDCLIEDTQGNPKYLLSYVEVDDKLNLTAIEIETQTVVAMLEAKNMHILLFDKQRVINEFLSKKGVKLKKEDIKFVYDDNYSSSCFDPLIKIKELGDYSLLLEPIQEKHFESTKL